MSESFDMKRNKKMIIIFKNIYTRVSLYTRYNIYRHSFNSIDYASGPEYLYPFPRGIYITMYIHIYIPTLFTRVQAKRERDNVLFRRNKTLSSSTSQYHCFTRAI